MTDITALRAAIAIDDWKLPIFERHLSHAGFLYENGVGLTPDTRHLYVTTSDLNTLEKVVRAANDEAAKYGRSPAQ